MILIKLPVGIDFDLVLTHWKKNWLLFMQIQLE